MRVAAPLLAAGAVIAGCVRNPATGKSELMLVSESQEIQMGQQSDSQVVASIGLYPNPSLQAYVQGLGTKLAATSERPKLPWTFRVVDDPAVNAFAIPGGFVYVTRGILAHMTNEAELATVMGHEIGHVTARHTAHQMSREQLASLGLAIGSIASSQVAKYAGVASQALGVLFLKFSRDNENQADELGVRYSSRGNYDSREMVNVMQMLDKIEAQSGGRLPEWLATHPNPGNRIEHITAVISRMQTDFAGATVNRDAFERRLDGIIFGMNPREGFFKGTEFFHPDLRFRISFPSGWRTTLRGTAVFIEYGRSVYRLLAYGSEASWSGNQDVAQRATSSFRPVNDPAVLNVQPQQISLITLDRRTTIARLAQQRPSPVSVPTLALINQVDDTTSLEPGRIVKWVVGPPLPGTP